MEVEKEILDWIDRYITGQMSEAEKNHFEAVLRNDSELRDKVSSHEEFLNLLVDYRENRNLKTELDKIHSSLPLEEMVELYKPQHSKIYILWKRYRVGVAIAASMGVLAISLTLHYLSQEKLKGQSNQVTALRRKLDKILSIQPSLISAHPQHSISQKSFEYGGTAFLLDTKGYLITNYHVLEGADSVYIQNRKGDSYKTILAYSNKAYDLAILKIEDTSFKSLGKLPYSLSQEKPGLSEPVFTLGYPRDEIVYNQGYLSAITGYEGDTLNYQVSMAVNPGNSGGPVLDSKGNILGILSAKQTSADGVAYAVRSTCLYDLANAKTGDSVLSQIISHYKTHRTSNQLAGLNRQQQIKKIQDFIFMVKAY